MNDNLSFGFNLSLEQVGQLFSTALFYQIPICMYEFDIRYKVRDIFVVFVSLLNCAVKLYRLSLVTMQNKMSSQFTEF